MEVMQARVQAWEEGGWGQGGRWEGEGGESGWHADSER